MSCKLASFALFAFIDVVMGECLLVLVPWGNLDLLDVMLEAMPFHLSLQDFLEFVYLRALLISLLFEGQCILPWP